MTIPAWQVSGQYYETCNCDFVCPCLPGGMTVSPSKESCNFAMAFEVSRGTYGTVSLDGLGFIVLGFTPGAMANGNWSVGLIADERASAEQSEAITAIASGAAGGPMAALSGLIGKFLGVQPAPIRFDRTGAKWSVRASDFVDMAAEGATPARLQCGVDSAVQTRRSSDDPAGHAGRPAVRTSRRGFSPAEDPWPRVFRPAPRKCNRRV